MSNISTIKEKIAKVEKGLKSKATPDAFKKKLKGTLADLQKELKKAESESKKAPKKTSTKDASKGKSPKDIAAKYKAKYGSKYGGNDIERDASRPAKPAGRRISESGKVYYENRDNRIDMKQPPKTYPKLGHGGELHRTQE